MDPMDFTMDDANASSSSSTAVTTATNNNTTTRENAGRFQCQHQHQHQHQHQQQQQQHQQQYHPQYPQPSHGFLPPRSDFPLPRENQRYDPVHDSSAGYYQHNNAASQSRPAYPPQPNLPQWAGPSFIPSAHNWRSDSPAGSQVPDASSFRTQPFAGAGSSAWGDGTGFDGPSFGYPVFAPQLNLPTGPSRMVRSGQENHSLPPNPHTLAQRQAWQASRARAAEIQRAGMNRLDHSFSSSSSIGSEARPSNHRTHHTPAAFLPYPQATGTPSRADGNLAVAQAQANARARARTLTNTLRAEESAVRRRHGHAYSSDEDDDSIPDLTAEEFRHNQEEIFFIHGADERTMAALRGAARKRIPSRAAMASLVSMTVEEVKAEGEDIMCMICYNDYGTSSPEGTIESPLRLPKCKHIFGDACIKKWFEDSDSCPYCRDKLPSEVSITKSAAHESFRLLREQHAFHSAYRRYPSTPRHPSDMDRGTDALSASRSDFARDEHENMMFRTPDFNFSHRPSDAPDRRRQRGRAFNNRSAQQLFGRTVSAGSVRQTPTGPASQRLTIPGRTLSSALTNGPPNLFSSPPRGTLSSSPSSSNEAASPPVVVGSFPSDVAQSRSQANSVSDQSTLANSGQSNTVRVSQNLPNFPQGSFGSASTAGQRPGEGYPTSQNAAGRERFPGGTGGVGSFIMNDMPIEALEASLRPTRWSR